MNKFILATFVTSCLLGSGLALAGEPAPAKVTELANSQLAALGSDAAIVAAVKQANAVGQTLEQIKAKDETWKSTPGLDDFMQKMLDNTCSKRLQEIQASKPFFAEIFVMDSQGANVCMSDKTSDYWQGDEAKFQKSFNGGQGAVFVDKVNFDESSQSYLAQVSVPVVDQGQVLGAITFGIDVDKVD